MRGFSILILPLLLLACERRPDGPTAPPAPPPSPTPAAPTVPGGATVRIRTLLPLRPHVPALLATDDAGSVFWVQSTDRPADEIVYRLDSDGVPHATALSAAAVLRMLGAPDGGGHFQSLAVADQRLFGYFAGGDGIRTLAALVRLDPGSGEVRIVADTRHLMDASGLGASIELAGGTLAATRQGVWLLLRHSDDWAMLRFRPGDIADNGQVRFTRPSNRLPAELHPTAEGLRLVAGAGATLLMVDPIDAGLWRIEPDGGARRILSLVGLPDVLSDPLETPDRGIILFAGASGTTLKAPTPDRIAPPPIRTDFPAMLILSEGRLSAWGPKALRAEPPLNAGALRPVPLLARGDHWIAQDPASGALLELDPK